MFGFLEILLSTCCVYCEDWRAGRELQGRPSLLGLRGIRPVEIEEDASIGLWLTAGAKDAARSSGKFYHEVQLFTDTGCPQFGWLSTGFEEGPHDGDGVGDDEHGYAFDGDRLLNWKAGRKQKAGGQPIQRGSPRK